MINSLPIYTIFTTFSFSAAQSNDDFNGGWASRQGESCATGQVSCGTRGPGFVACCPSDTICLSPVSIPGFTDNTGCCPTGSDCSFNLETLNICADSSWSLYNNSGHPFCCEAGFDGGMGSYYDSCRDDGFPAGETALPVETPGSPLFGTTSSTSVSTISSSTRSAVSTTISTTSPTSLALTSSSLSSGTAPTGGPASSGLSGGVIAGIVIGSIFGVLLLGILAWVMGRKIALKRGQNTIAVSQMAQVGGIDSGPPPSYGRP